MNKLLMPALLLIFMLTGLSVIYSKYSSRTAFIEIQKAEQILDQLEVSWERLTLEEKMLSEHNRVERIARKKMKLIALDRKKIVYIKL
ncbi:MAG: cell division protein FtsL [Methyloprofundus sp.]|nr:cell division protein FtsL [Methyloprofundus sp.]